MPDPLADLYTYIKAQTPVTNVIGTGNSCRFYKTIAPNTASFPYVVYNVLPGDIPHHMGGSCGIVEHQLQIDVYATTAKSARDLADLLRAELDGLRSFLNGAGSTDVRKCFLKSDGEVPPEKKPDGSADVYHRWSQTYDFSYFRAASSP